MLKIRLPIPRFVSAGEIFAGRGSIGALRALDATRAVVLVSRSILRDAGLAGKVGAAINAHELHLLEAPAGEPSLGKLCPLAAEVSGFRPDWIVAIGGGSVLDAGKLLWILYEHPDIDLVRVARPFALPALRGKARFVAVPTTAGTGSEVSSSAILAAEDGRKIPIVSHDLLPDVVILDPTLAQGLPRRAAVAAGLDALAHAVEGYVSRFANPLADTFAESAARTLLAALPATLDRPEDADLRLEVMQAALLAGWVQNLKVPGIGHAVAHQLGRFGIAHGAACGALLPASITLNAADDSARRKYDRLAAAIGVGDHDGLRAAIMALRERIGAAQGLAVLAAGGEAALRADLPRIAEGAMADVCARANPRAVDAALVAAAIEGAMNP